MRSSTSARTRRGNGSKYRRWAGAPSQPKLKSPPGLLPRGPVPRVRLIPLVWRGMDRTVALVVASAIGGVLAAQAPLNSTLARTVGGVQASVVALGISFAALAALCAVSGGFSGLARLGEAPLHVAVGGGLIGALYVGSIVWTVRALGAGGLTAATIAGQLALAVVIDHYGWLGVARSPITASKVLGIALLALGTWFVVRD